MNDPIVIECSDKLAAFLDALLVSGLFGSSRDSVAQRLLELKVWEMAQPFVVEKK